jgi:hypothetical protein
VRKLNHNQTSNDPRVRPRELEQAAPRLGEPHSCRCVVGRNQSTAEPVWGFKEEKKNAAARVSVRGVENRKKTTADKKKDMADNTSLQWPCISDASASGELGARATWRCHLTLWCGVVWCGVAWRGVA